MGKLLTFKDMKVLRLAMSLPLSGHTGWLNPDILSKTFKM